jgi:quercetin dioxygenase-like cupin family protein
MEAGELIVFDDLGSLEMRPSRLAPYDGEIGVRLLYHDPVSGVEHDLIRYPAGLKAKLHRHTAAHTIVLLQGRLAVNDEVVAPGAYCHFPAGEPMFHAPAGQEDCLFVIIFHGPFDVEVVGDEAFRSGPS